MCVKIPTGSHLHRVYNTESELTERLLSEREILETLSPALRTKVVLHVNKQVLGGVDIFDSDVVDPEFTILIISSLKPVYYAPDEIVVREGDPGSHMYIISKGEVEVIKYDTLRIAVLTEGNYFGEMALFDERFLGMPDGTKSLSA